MAKRMVGIGIGVVGIVVIMAVTAYALTRSQSSGDNRANARLYVSARQQRVRAIRERISHDRSIVIGAGTNLISQCANPGFDAGGEQAAPLRLELLDVLSGELLRSEEVATRAFAVHARRLRWADKRISGLVGALINQESAMAHLRMPNVCNDVIAWRKHHRVPHETKRFLYEVAVASADVYKQLVGLKKQDELPGAVVLTMMRRYERPSEVAQSRMLSRAEHEALLARLGVVVKAARMVFAQLGIARSPGAST